MDIIFSWQMLITALSIYIIISTIKGIGNSCKSFGDFLKKPLVKAAILTPFNPILGGAIGAIPGRLPLGDVPMISRILTGAVAGLMSTFAYTMLKQRAGVNDVE